MIEYINRYSDNDLPDSFGRWARIGKFKNITIAWISRVEFGENIVFLASCYFPTLPNDTANETKNFKTLEEAKEFIENRWEWFLKEIAS
jgi:hypothetical protein